MDPKQRLRAQARRHWGLFTVDQARACGLTDRMRAGMLASGAIERVYPRVFRFAGLPWTFEARQVAAVLACGPNGCVSHSGAARLLGLAVPAGRPEVTVTARGPRLSGVRVHRTRCLDPGDVTTIAGVPCTTGSRTLIDLAPRLSAVRRIALVDEAIAAGVASRASLHRRACALSSGRAGVATLADITRPGVEGGFWSALGRRFARALRAHHLPTPQYNAAVRIRGRLFYADALWQRERLVAELHGLRFHDSPRRRHDDAERANAFTLAGFRALAFTWRQVLEDPAWVAGQVRGALGLPEPSTGAGSRRGCL